MNQLGVLSLVLPWILALEILILLMLLLLIMIDLSSQNPRPSV
jgi:hypothetical protein